MPGLKDAKLLGGIGSVLALVPYVNIAGYILVLIAIKYISDETKKPSIFQNALYAAIILMIGWFVATISAFLFLVYLRLIPLSFFPLPLPPAGLEWGLASAIVALMALIFAIVGIVFFRRSLNEIGNIFNIPYFFTAGTLLLIGAILLFVLVGSVIILIGWVFLIIAFFSLPETYKPSAGSTPQ